MIKALDDEIGLFEKSYINNKYLNGYLDIFIFYDYIDNIDQFIKNLLNQTILNKCNLYFIKNISNNKNITSDEILYNNFMPFKSKNYNAYFFKASSFEEAEILFKKHSFLPNKIFLDLNKNNLLNNSKFLEEQYEVMK
jgi:hypothetical protein